MIDLFEHNKKAYESAVSMLSENGKAAIIHPTGTGKSFIGFKLCEDNPDKVICWLSPSSYIFKTQLENLAKVSDGYTPNNIKFFTYAKLINLSDEEIGAICPDYIVLDEFHRCGAYEWGKGVDALLKLYDGVPVLGLSATNVRYLDNRRDMAYELFDGNIASEMTLGEAIVRGILAEPKYVISVYSYQKDLEKYKRRIENAKNEAVKDAALQYLEALRRALEKADGLDEVFSKYMSDRTGKYIVFCADFEHMRAMIDEASKWFAKVDAAPKIYSVYSADPLASQAFLDFKADKDNSHLRLLYCIDALNEGVHLSDISGVIMVRPTVSPIIYKQQIGRALAANQKNSPIIFDIVNNFENLYSVGAVEEEMKAAINYYRYRGEKDEIVREKFRIIDEVRDCKRLFDELNDTLSASWDMMYNLAERYYEEHGDLVPQNNYKTAEGYSLGAWINTQRMVRRGTAKGYLSDAQIARLDAIGMRWETKRDCTWDKNYAELLKYYEQYGNIDVPYDYKTENGFALGNWIIDLRVAYNSGIKKSVLLPKRIEQLGSIGMIWNKIDYIWENNYQALLKYYKEHGNAAISKNYKTEDGIALGTWIYNIKSNYRISRGNSLSTLQKERLESLGVELSYEDASEKRWKQNYAKAAEYYDAHGDLCVPYNYVTDDGFALGTWISRLRAANRCKTHIALTDDRKRQLDNIGMVWDCTDASSWDMYYSALKQYYEEYGNIRMNAKTLYHDIRLGAWLIGKREQFRKGVLPENQKRDLNVLGMDWLTSRERQWENEFKLAESYYGEYGNLDVPSSMTELYSWLARQRKNQRKGLLKEEQYERLSSIGMIWEQDDAWKRYYAKAEAYYEKNGNLDIPAEYVTDDGVALGRWYRTKRKEYLDGTMTDEQRKQLDAIGMRAESVLKRNWFRNYECAKAFFEKNNHLAVHAKYVTDGGVNLGSWLTSQRESYKSGRLTEEQISLLNSIGMQWDRSGANWNRFYGLAVEYFEKYGNLDVAADYETEDGTKLGVWIVTQRNKYKQFKLSKRQIESLEKLGIVWNPSDDNWEDGYRHAREYYRQHNNLDVKNGYICDDGFKLASWISNKKTKYKSGKLSTEKAELLEKLGIVWHKNEAKWEAAYREAEIYYSTYHHLNVPQSYQTQNGFYLSYWLTAQQKKYAQGKLETEKVKRLQRIGMTFEGAPNVGAIPKKIDGRCEQKGVFYEQ